MSTLVVAWPVRSDHGSNTAQHHGRGSDPTSLIREEIWIPNSKYSVY